MALPSQTVRESTSRRMMSNVGARRRRGVPWMMILIIVIALAAVAALAYWRGWFGGGSGTPTPPAAVAPTSVSAPAATPRPTLPPAPAPAPTPTPTPSPAPAPVAQKPKPSAPAAAAKAPAVPAAPAAPAAKPAQAASATQAVTPEQLAAQVNAAVALIPRDPVAARRALTAAIDTRQLRGAALDEALRGIEVVNSQLLFAPVVVVADPLQTSYTIKQGDSLAKIARAAGMKADWRLLQRLNGIKDPGRIAVGQKLKVPLGAFHAVVHKDSFRMDVYQESGAERVIVASFPVGLGERNGTPAGTFKIRANSKLIDPEWRNPRTGEFFSSGDPKNPIGEHWIGLAGADDATKNFLGYGIHGTIEPDSIGKNASMGCVRMRTEDVALVYELLTEGDSRIEIAP